MHEMQLKWMLIKIIQWSYRLGQYSLLRSGQAASFKKWVKVGAGCNDVYWLN